MKTRIISAIVGIAILIPVLWFSGTLVFPLVMALLAMLAAGEICFAVGARKKYYYLIPSLLYALGLPLLLWLTFSGGRLAVAVSGLVSIAYILVLFFITVLLGGKEKFSSVAEIAVGVVYVTVAFASLYLLRALNGGAYIYGLVFIGSWVTDTMAYFSGRLFGKHKLCPAISPKKTVEGSIGGTVFCLLGFVLYGFIMQKCCDLSPNYLMLAIAGAAVALVSQMGDLTASLLKREHNVKDYGRIMPGHGGVMDRFDSIIAVSIFLLLWRALPQTFAFFY